MKVRVAINSVLFILAFFLAVLSADAQFSGHLGQRFKAETAFSPSLVFIPFWNEVFRDDLTNEFPERWFSKEVSMSYYISRKHTLKFSFRNARFKTGNESGIPLSARVNSIQVSYCKYPAIVPLRYYQVFGFGIDVIDVNPNEEFSDLVNLEEKTSWNIPYLAYAVGANYFISDHVYLSSELRLNASVTIVPLGYDTGKNWGRYMRNRQFPRERLLEAKIGIGISI